MYYVWKLKNSFIRTESDLWSSLFDELLHILVPVCSLCQSVSQQETVAPSELKKSFMKGIFAALRQLINNDESPRELAP